MNVRLESAGLAPRIETERTDVEGVAHGGAHYRLGNAVLHVYLYPDSLARVAAAAALPTGRFVAPAAMLTMKGEPTLIQNANLLAILESRNDHQRERVSDALNAGPPQPRK
ncbi:MAG: hypothetical protein JWO05_2637 [Gemmatimonadetes bacterium]|nr:hypothetical protein [Gemmatimonadota bacterium]